MEFGPEDMVEFGRYYLPSLLCSLVACVAMFVLTVLAVRLRPGCRSLKVLGVCLVPVPLICWILYFNATSELTYTLVLLGSESSQVAERTYVNRFKRQVNTLDSAVRLAVSRHQEPNVRFYASCLVADMLATNQTAAKTVFKRVENADTIDTQFFDGNGLTDGFYVPGHAQVHLSVRDIVEQRLHLLRTAGQ
jgi:hypothetical protein